MRQELKKKVGIKMRNLRKGMGLTQEKMVTHFDKIGRANYSRIEKGEIFPNESILYTLIKKLKISLNWFIADEGQMMLTKRKNRDFMECGEELDDLFYHIKKIPMVKHAVLAFFLEYKQKNNKLIKKLVEEVEKKEQKQKTNSPKT
jgi:transcriptional regulator with XRE-family HTH domain